MEVAAEYGHIPRNPASGRRRRVKVPEKKRTWVEVEQLPSLLDAADAYMKPVIALLAGAGLRNGEACALDWRDVNLATGTLTVGRSKTNAGSYREVDLPGGLIEALSEWKVIRHPEADEPVLVTRMGRRQTEENVARRLKTVIRRANKRLAELGIEPISEKVTPHSLRRTWASQRAASEDDSVYTAQQGGWTDTNFVSRFYQKAAKRRARLSGPYLAEFDRALAWAAISAPEKAAKGSGAIASPKEAVPRESVVDPETA